MKIKTDHVTNSSSASFIIDKEKLTDLQIFLIKNHVEFVKVYHPQALDFNSYFNRGPEYSGWIVNETDEYLEGETSMDNFDMMWFLEEIGIAQEDIDYNRE